MKNYSLFIGVDVSKLKLDIVGVDPNNQVLLPHKVLDNKEGDLKLFLTKVIQKFGKDDILVSFENTGVYGMILAHILTKLQIDYCEISALEINRSKGIKRGKSDKSDASIIVQYTIANQFKIKLSSLTEVNISKLKLLYTQREKIVKTIKQFEFNKENEGFIPKPAFKELMKTNTSIVKNLKKNLKLINQQILEIINNNQALKTNYELIQSIPGIGPQTASYLLIVTKGFTVFDNSRQLACYAGVAPFPYQSGSSIRGRNKVSHLADKKLKSLLNMCALNAKRYDYQLKMYFESKVKDGKNKMLILNNIRNKLLHRVFAVIKRQQPYVNIHNFAA
ncbi:IS110 family transposase [uncultured Aquimarina sp.]|uniref:IS110 family transposase n=1 Tax=uncultured Aquimarina sp. TaxID=575652 RepID=UPI00262E0806|nr:IS110 family transposase [uncultured Aquimarina sp.]